MGSRSSNAIDLAIEKKLNSSYVLNCTKNELFKFAKAKAAKKVEVFSFNAALPNLNLEKDIYNNEVCNFLDFKFQKTQSRFNLLRLFKPGEILSAVVAGE